MECILDCNYLLLKNPLVECKIQFHWDKECILDCNYLLLKASLGECKNTVPQGYGMYFRPYLSLIENSAGGV